MLRRFAILCGGDYMQAVVLNHLYYEAYEHNGGKEGYVLTTSVDELSVELSQTDDEFSYCLVALSEGADLIDFHFIWRRNEDTALGEEIIGYSCTPYIQVIEARLARIEEEADKVKKHNKRAIELNHPGTLTVEKWIKMLNDFQWACAYCDGEYDVLEHVIPLTFPDSGTRRWNCVPACNKCNSLKGPYHPDRLPRKIKNSIGEKVERVRKQLNVWESNYKENSRSTSKI